MVQAAVLLLGLVLFGASTSVHAQTNGGLYQRVVPNEFRLSCYDGYELMADHGDVETWATAMAAALANTDAEDTGMVPKTDSDALPVVDELPARQKVGLCRKCTPGTGSLDGIRCIPCTIGYYQNLDGQKECKICEVGTISTTTAAFYRRDYYRGALQEPLGIPEANLDDTDGATHTVDAAYLTARTDITTYTAALADYQAAGAGLTQAGTVMQTGTIWDDTAALDTTSNYPGVKWVAGTGLTYYVGVVGGDGCSTCPKGYYQPAKGGMMCLPCPAGSYTAAVGASECTLCEVGKFSSTAGNDAGCDNCPANTYASYEGQTVCQSCPLGSVANAAVGATGCTKCAPGTYRGNPTTDCLTCPPGTYSDYPGATFCKPAPLGAFVAAATANKTFYELCSPGQYTPNWGSETCIDCPPGTYTDVEGMPTCVPCKPGHWSALGAAECTALPAGRVVPWPSVPYQEVYESDTSLIVYASLDGEVKDLAPRGYFNDPLVEDYEDPSNAGTYIARPQHPISGWDLKPYEKRILAADGGSGWNATVRLAVTGKLLVSSQALGMACPLGHYQGTPGQATCLPCAPGSKASTVAMTACTACPIGTSSLAPATKCFACPKGTMAPTQGSASCTSCLKGYYQDLPGMGYCNPAPIGGYVDTIGAIGYYVCPPGTITPKQGYARCMECSAGFYADVPREHDAIYAQLPNFNPKQPNAQFATNVLTAGAPTDATIGQLYPDPDDVGELPGPSLPAGDGFLADCTASGTDDVPYGYPGSSTRAGCTLADYQALLDDRKFGAYSCRACQAGKFSIRRTHVVTDASNSCIPCGPGFYGNRPGLAGRFWGRTMPAGIHQYNVTGPGGGDPLVDTGATAFPGATVTDTMNADDPLSTNLTYTCSVSSNTFACTAVAVPAAYQAWNLRIDSTTPYGLYQDLEHIEFRGWDTSVDPAVKIEWLNYGFFQCDRCPASEYTCQFGLTRCSKTPCDGIADKPVPPVPATALSPPPPRLSPPPSPAPPSPLPPPTPPPARRRRGI